MRKLLIFGMIWTIFFLPEISKALDRSKTIKNKTQIRDDQKRRRTDKLVIQRINGPVTLDGLSDEFAWKGINPLPFVMYMPNYGEESSERTEAFVAYDENYLYIAGRLFDRESSKIQANSKQRDSQDPSSDWFGIVIDSFNDNENALAFFTTPSGLRWDAAVSNDAQVPFPYNLSWNTFWDVATTQNKEGWFAEIRIPFSSLRFQDKDGRVTMGIIVRRRIARNDEWDVFPDISPNWGEYGFFKPSKAQKIVLEGVYSHNPIYITPYLLGGAALSHDLDEKGSVFLPTTSFERQAGLDIKYGLTSNFTLDLTVNTDFAQVEADDQQINLTRFSLYFPEKRLFFQERSSIFDFTFDKMTSSRLFHSRRIGIHDGEIVRIYGGVRLVGRVGPWDLGFLNMQTASTEDLPSENYGVFRIRRQVFNPYSYIGAITTVKMDFNGNYNYAYGIDAIIRVFGDDYLTFKWAQTFENGLENNFLSLKPVRFRFNWLRRSSKGFSYGLSLSRAGSAYNPGMGFEPREDFFRAASGVTYGWFPGAGSLFFSQSVSLTGILFFRNYDKFLESAIVSTGWSFRTKTGWTVNIEPTVFFENVPETFSISELAVVPDGRYSFFCMNAGFTTPSGKERYIKTTLDLGQFYDGWRTSLSLEPRLNLTSDLEISSTYQFNRISFSKRSQKFTAHIARLRVLYMMSTRFSGSAFLQFNSIFDGLIANIRFRYNPREGIDLYLVYNESFNTDRYQRDIFFPLTSSRTILVKFTYTFNL